MNITLLLNKSLIILPKINGITIRNENFAVSFFLLPKSNEVHIVAPDLEMPGSIAIACAIPIIIASVVPTFLSDDFALSDKKSNKPVIINIPPTRVTYITLNQWFDKSLLNEIDIQPLYYPSINKNNFDDYKQKFFKEFEEYPSHLSLLSYDLVGLVYYLSLKNNFSDTNKLFKVKNSFKGKIGIFDIKNNKINHRLNFYKIEDKKLIKIF